MWWRRLRWFGVEDVGAIILSTNLVSLKMMLPAFIVVGIKFFVGGLSRGWGKEESVFVCCVDVGVVVDVWSVVLTASSS